MGTYILSLGSNDGDRELNLQKSFNFLEEICDAFYPSTPYESPAIGGNAVHYLNAVAAVEFTGTAHTLDHMLKAAEIMCGRDSKARAEHRVPLDMDIVIADGEIIRPKDFSQYFFKRGYEELLSCGIIN